eukprot:CAMPEP_0181471414 /NCGR_PEP_ID=MMETSP1110-20121109/39061_1 /TAXON_ID=174948 /ORGANISM="Symbiodinium sp., Strain CCMP421" /LENGTH=142 /DNA_ID=CAMNT_0023596429 /DNA_START=635 /DNA_END=1063 /DNA_ORIENTATION=-
MTFSISTKVISRSCRLQFSATSVPSSPSSWRSSSRESADSSFSLSSCHSKSRFGEDTAADVQGMLQVGEGGAVDAVEDGRSCIFFASNASVRMSSSSSGVIHMGELINKSTSSSGSISVSLSRDSGGVWSSGGVNGDAMSMS